jgi:hypothetical protein
MWDHDHSVVTCDGPGCINHAMAPTGLPRGGWLVVADANEGTDALVLCSWRCLALLAQSVAAV